MPVQLTWHEIAIRILLAMAASFLIGYDRDERGKSAGIRTTMLVCLAATLAMLQVNLLLNMRGRSTDSFVMNDLMRLPLGILSGIGFIGAGAILRKDGLVRGVTTAATLWFVTVLGLIFGGGQIALALGGTAIALFILWVLKYVENALPTHKTGTLSLALNATSQAPTESELRDLLHTAHFHIRTWTARYEGRSLAFLECELQWPSKGRSEPGMPSAFSVLSGRQGVASLVWRS